MIFKCGKNLKPTFVLENFTTNFPSFKMNSLLTKHIEQHCLRFMTTVAKQTPSEYCLESVRRNDYENFLCTLLLPHEIRSAGLAIRAFNIEIAQIEDQVSNKNIGAMRFTFWTQALNDIYDNKPPRNPVALELHRVLKKHDLSKRYFKRLIDARLNKLNNSFFVDLESMEKYSEDTVSSIYYLLLEAQNIKKLDADHAASHLGKAHGIVTLIRSVSHNIQKRLIVLPQDVMMKHNVSSEAVFQGKISKDFNDVIYEVASCAKRHVDQARSIKKSKLGKETNAIFLPIHLVESYLEKLRRVDFDVFHSKLYIQNHFLPLQLLWRKYGF